MDAQERILNLLEGGKVTAAEAAELLRALKGNAAALQVAVQGCPCCEESAEEAGGEGDG